jgi:putative ABC transport system substrate-binding protein
MQSGQLRRREFITLLGGAAVAWPLAARAQQVDRVRRLGILMTQAAGDSEVRVRLNSFRQNLQRLGWVEGKNIRIEYRYAEGQADRARAYAAELVAMGPDVILANGTAILRAFREQASSIPIVFVMAPDPLGDGFVASLSRPGGFITGFTNFEFSMASKWLEILKQLAPPMTRVAMLFNPEAAPYAKYFAQAIENVPAAYRMQLISAPVRAPREIEQTVAEFARQTDGGLLVVPDLFTAGHRDLIVAVVREHRLPTIYPFRYFVERGGLISYGSVTEDVFGRSASYIDSILRGTKPADLPIQQPTKFELVINLKTAKSLGLEVAPTLLALADEVIE